MRTVLVYTLSRLALFAASAGVLYEAGFRGALLVAVALLISGVVSYVLLSGQRDRMSAAMMDRAARLRRGLAEGAAREDDEKS